MKTLYTYFIIGFTLFLLINISNAQNPDWVWVKSTGAGEAESNGVATDANGNIYIVGSFRSAAITFGTVTLTNNGTENMFIAKYDSSGNVLWASNARISTYDYATAVTTDASGNIYVVGCFTSPTIVFGSITLTNASSGTRDMFIVKYDASGNVLWAKGTGGTFNDDVTGVAVDGLGNSYMTGYYGSVSITFGSTTLTCSDDTLSDIFLVKYNQSGNIVWAKGSTGGSWDYSNGICTDASNNVYITGYYKSATLTFGTVVLNNTNYIDDVFLVKFDANGTALWGETAGGAGSDYGYSVTTDASGNVYITGIFGSTSITFDSYTLTNGGEKDIFLTKYNTSGTALWAKRAGGSKVEFSKSVATYSDGSIYITGMYFGTSVTFGTTTLTNNGSSDIFVTKYNDAGNVVWAKGAGGTSAEIGNCVATGTSESVYVTGWFKSSSAKFGSITLASSSMEDLFLAKLSKYGIGMDEKRINISVNLYPNPSNGFIYLDVEEYTKENLLLEIADIHGKIIYSEWLENSHNTITKQINLTELPKGIYFVKIQGNDLMNVRKLVIQ